VYPEYGTGGPNRDRAVSGSDILSGSVFEGWNIGAVSVKRVRLQGGGAIEGEVRRHGGDPAGTICSMLDSGGGVPMVLS
jgi:hypothetical protein